MKKLTFLLCILIVSIIKVSSQNSAIILAPKYQTEIINLTSLPTFGPNDDEPLTGYDGQKANHSQNIQVNQAGEIMFFIVDAFIYDRNGKMIDAITENDGDYGDISGYMGEVVVIPVPNETNCTAEYYIFTSKYGSSGSVIEGRPYFSKLRIEYDLNDELLPTSGLQLIISNNQTMKSLI